ncbi:MAG: flagellar hook-basal body complex protein [Chthoniobacteraceae bacterium]
MSLIASLDSGVAALETFSKGIQVIANNIANVNTTGYKGSRASYADNFSNLLQQGAPSSGTGAGSNLDAIQVGTGVHLQAANSNFEQGTLTSTGSSSDLGISGSGFFIVRDSVNGVSYATRSGDFRIDDQGYLVTAEGYRVQGLADGTATFDATDVGGTLTFTKTATLPSTVGDIKINFDVSVGSGITNSTGGTFTDADVNKLKPSQTGFSIGRKGDIDISLSNGTNVRVGRVLLQNYRDPNALTREGNNLFTGFEAAGPIGGVALSDTTNSPGANGNGELVMNTLELSNVDLSQEFSNMIVTQRSFQAGSRIVTVSDSLLEEVINLKR